MLKTKHPSDSDVDGLMMMKHKVGPRQNARIPPYQQTASVPGPQF